jgi:ribonucleoside-diphosphate reductase alpha chain
MKVLKRNNHYELVQFDKITNRISCLCTGLSKVIDPVVVAKTTIESIYNGITTEELDKISAGVAESYKLVYPDYSALAARILVSNLHKSTPDKFSVCTKILNDHLSIMSAAHCRFIEQHADELDSMIIHDNDYMFDYLGFKTLEYSYLNKINERCCGNQGRPILIDYDGREVKPDEVIRFNKKGMPITTRAGRTIILKTKTTRRIVDRPQYMFMRVAVAIYMDSEDCLTRIKECYSALSTHLISHATPTLYNSCTKKQQMLSCFLLGEHDSIEGIMKAISDASLISKCAGGIGVCMSKIRSHGALIHGTNGQSSGIPNQLKIWNDAARCWDQGGRRNGSFAIYLEPWHGDIMKFLEMRLAGGDDNHRARDLFYALWVPDLFVEKAEDDGDWLLFSPDTAPGLCEVYDGMEVCQLCGYCANGAYAKYILGRDDIELEGKTLPPAADQRVCDHQYQWVDAFTQLYESYADEGLSVGCVKAREVLDALCIPQRESGMPYISFKDNANRMTNQKNIGTITASNLCDEIYEWANYKSYACCVLASMNLKKFIVRQGDEYVIDHVALHASTRLAARNLDILIDKNIYPVDECKQNSFDYRPIAVGVQGMADTFMEMGLPFLSAAAEKIDLEVAETIYHAALTESCDRARQYGAYKEFAGSPASRGQLQPDLWMANNDYITRRSSRRGRPPSVFAGINPLSGRYDFDLLKASIREHGLRNSLHVAYMPTVSTSQIMGNNESFEPIPSNFYTKNILAGKYTLTNHRLINDLIKLGLWNEDMKNRIINDNGSVQKIMEIPSHTREIYKTVWEMNQKDIMRRAALRSAFVDQGQSLNINTLNNSNAVLRGVFFTGREYGLKTGSYYIRTQPAFEPLKNNIAASRGPAVDNAPLEMMCRLDDPTCTSCSL